MNPDDDFELSYVIFNEAWYYNPESNRSKEVTAEICIGFYSKTEGGTTGEFSLSWSMINDELVMKATVFTDGFNAFYDFLELFSDYSDNPNPTIEMVVEALKKYGAVDSTKRTR